MEELTNESKKSTDYISRYSNFSYAYNEVDDKYIYELTNQLDDTTPYAVYTVNKSDTLDYLSNKYYGRPDYYWVIADTNRIKDVFEPLYPKYKTIKIPTLTSIKYKN